MKHPTNHSDGNRCKDRQANRRHHDAQPINAPPVVARQCRHALGVLAVVRARLFPMPHDGLSHFNGT